ncbi:hypothetical protein BDD12DRAFT_894585 [Trichophaea hybrida]|nr:hypothetical protein BDD12DRAFT_894585 [Trichophaea hybrida]
MGIKALTNNSPQFISQLFKDFLHSRYPTMNQIPLEPWQHARSVFLKDLTFEEKNLFDIKDLRRKVTALGPLFDALCQYSKALGVFASLFPSVMGPLWGSIRVPLQIANELSIYFDMLVDMLVQIGDVLPRFRDYEELFPNHQRLLYYISNAYLDIIKFCTQAKSVFKKSNKAISARILFGPIWKSFDIQFGQIMDDFRRHRDKVDREAQVGHMWLVKKNMDVAERLHRDDKRQRLLMRLPKDDYRGRFRNSLSRRHKDTGTWVLDTSEFSSWRDQNESTILWCYVGCGKTIAM